jgi:hypothetical protein
MREGDRVRTWQGRYGVIVYRTKDGWYGVQEASGRIDEWQWWQLDAA